MDQAPLAEPQPVQGIRSFVPREVPVTEPRTTGKTDTAAETVATAIGRLTRDGGTDDGGATAADIAAAAGMAYSTTNKKLRALKDAGRATSFDGPDKRTLWRLTTAGPADTIGATPDGTEPEPVTEPEHATQPEPSDGPDPGLTREPAADT